MNSQGTQSDLFDLHFYFAYLMFQNFLINLWKLITRFRFSTLSKTIWNICLNNLVEGLIKYFYQQKRNRKISFLHYLAKKNLICFGKQILFQLKREKILIMYTWWVYYYYICAQQIRDDKLHLGMLIFLTIDDSYKNTYVILT